MKILEADWENIEKMIKNNVPYDKIGKIYNCTGSYIRKKAKLRGIELPKRREINPKETFNKGKGKKCPYCGKPIDKQWKKFCCDDCRRNFNHERLVKEWKEGKINGCDVNGSPRDFLRKYFLEKNDCKCEKCGYDKINPYTGYSILQIHHKDGDCYNNDESNLELLCPNCHALTENFGNRNTRATRILWENKFKRNKDS